MAVHRAGAAARRGWAVWMRAAGPMLLAVLMPSASRSVPVERGGSRSYSNLCRSAMSDDIGGHRFDMETAGAGTRIRYYWTDGQVRGPADATDVRFDRRTGALSFHADTPDGRAVFNGHVKAGAIAGELKEGWSSSPSFTTLRRSAPGAIPACRPL